jgi:hypothetical protein
VYAPIHKQTKKRDKEKEKREKERKEKERLEVLIYQML